MRIQLLDQSLLGDNPEAFAGAVAVVKDKLSNLSSFYPGFDDWFQTKVEAGLLTGERRIVMRYAEGVLSGVAVLKNAAEEKKICCLRVMPEFAGTGVGVRLFEDAFELLETDKPLLSVCEEQLPKFDRLFAHFGFQHFKKYDAFYRAAHAEHSFNGPLHPYKTAL